MYRKLVAVGLVLACASIAWGATPHSGATPPFVRGDANDDGDLDIADVNYLSAALFQGGPALNCWDAGDIQDSDTVDISDVYALSAYLFQGGSAPAYPFPDCDQEVWEETDGVPCEKSVCVLSIPHEREFYRGDVTFPGSWQNGVLNQDDVDALEARIAEPAQPVWCEDAADVNDDGSISQADWILLDDYVNGGLPLPQINPPRACDQEDGIDDRLWCAVGCQQS